MTPTTDNAVSPVRELSDERLQILIDGARHDIENQTSTRYKREAAELHSIASELLSRRMSASPVKSLDEFYRRLHPYLRPFVDEQVKDELTELLSRRSLDDGVEPFDMLAHLTRQREWSGNTFGPGPRTAGVIDHIRKELREIEADPTDITEWIDVVILALDGAWRAGYQPQEIIDAMVAKQTRNEGRNWPDWRTMSPDKAIEHDRTGEASRTPNTEVVVKALEWSENGVCETPFWDYFISRHVDGHYRLARTGVPSKDWTEHPTIAALEVAAQADFDQRIRSALASPPSPAQTVTDEMVETAARAMEPMAFREEFTATDEWYELEQEGRSQALGRARAALTAALAQHSKEG